jgi:16S rRNA (cytidine1402-2'-O)-methyltransferase
MAGKLYLVSTPIGNFRDITLRALDVLRSADAVICEEYRAGSTILKKLDVTAKDLILLNEHNEKDASPQIAQEILAGKTYALISDCGTPAFADPGTHLIRLCLQYGLRVVPVPGPSSLMTAISLSPLPLEEFYFVGFLPRKKEEREVRLGALKRLKVALVIMESPYRLDRILQEVAETFGDGQLITLAFNLTLKGEEVFHNTVAMVRGKVESKKGEFVLIVHRQ